MNAGKTLRSNPKSKKSVEVLQQAYPLAQANSLRKIKNAFKANVSNKYSIAADEYLALNSI